MVDLDLRLVQSFVALAEHRHFGRAAAALHTTQPSLTRQIGRLEKQVGARLVDRSVRGSELTDAGAVFLPQARALLHAAEVTVTCTRAADRPSRITVGHTEGLFVTAAVRDLQHRHPGADIRTQYLPCDQAVTAVLDHRADAVVARDPFHPSADLDDVRVTVLYEVPRVLVIGAGHRFAGKESVTLEDVAGEPMVRLATADPAWNALWRLESRHGGRRPPEGPVAQTPTDKFELVASGRAVIVSAGPHATGIRPDLVTVPIEDVEPGRVAVVSRAGERNPLVADFLGSASAHLTVPAG